MTDDNAEYVIPVRWLDGHPRHRGVLGERMFANQNSACKLRQEFTLDRLTQHFDLDHLESSE